MAAVVCSLLWVGVVLMSRWGSWMFFGDEGTFLRLDGTRLPKRTLLSFLLLVSYHFRDASGIYGNDMEGNLISGPRTTGWDRAGGYLLTSARLIKSWIHLSNGK